MDYYQFVLKKRLGTVSVVYQRQTLEKPSHHENQRASKQVLSK